ncbi:MAG: aminoglycoside phosphotransferase family protein [Bacilli bacterium]|nr:aminoglycoside phosphotransferase family protein [Bacilli bacterium]
MTKIEEKWRESLIDIKEIDFKNIQFEKIISYPPAGNDVFECIGKKDNKKINFIIKSERGKFANFENEIKVLPKLKKLLPIPSIIEYGKLDNYTYIVLSKIEGEKLSDIFKENDISDIERNDYLFKYGCELANIHNIKIEWTIARQRPINTYPSKEEYQNLTDWENSIIDYLKETKPKQLNYDTFIHGDFHYGNILWENNNISGILDWEYSGIGLKEQDIAWSVILRPGQQFMNTKEDITSFLKGYSSNQTYNKQVLKWCLLNGSMHFYLMNKNNGDKEYLNYLYNFINKILIIK